MQVSLLHARSHRLAESMLWHAARQRWYWVDLLEPCLSSHDPLTGKSDQRPLAITPPIGSIAATTDPDRVMLAHVGGLSVLHLDTLRMEPFCNPEDGRDSIIANDIKTDRWGRLWFGTSHVRETEPRGALWCVTPDGKAALCDAGFPVSNGPAFSPDGATMYFNDSANRQTLAYDLARADPYPRNRRIFAQYAEDEGMPDGLTVDAEGTIWSAQWLGARIIRLSPGGRRIGEIQVAAGHVTSLAFGGSDYADVLVTSARDGLDDSALGKFPFSGSIFACRPGAQGLPEPLFGI